MGEQRDRREAPAGGPTADPPSAAAPVHAHGAAEPGPDTRGPSATDGFEVDAPLLTWGDPVDEERVLIPATAGPDVAAQAEGGHSARASAEVLLTALGRALGHLWRALARAWGHAGVRLAALVAVGLAVFVVLLYAVAPLVWPSATLASDSEALARMSVPSYAGTATAVASTSRGSLIPLRVEGSQLWPLQQLDQAERVTVAVTVHPPSWASWLVGRSHVSTFTVTTPSVHLRTNLLTARRGWPVVVAFDAPVHAVAIGDSPARRLSRPQTSVDLGVVALGDKRAGQLKVAAAPRTWERLSVPITVTWFIPKSYTQMVVQPAVDASITPDSQLRLTFSRPVAAVLGNTRPRLVPAARGQWKTVDAHTLVFQPHSVGYGIGGIQRVELPKSVRLFGKNGYEVVDSLEWQVKPGKLLRAQQILAQLGYLPLVWTPTGAPVATSSVAAQIAAASAPPPGRFSWRYPATPPELRGLWRENLANEFTVGAIMNFERIHGRRPDGKLTPFVWRDLISDAMAEKRDPEGYSYVWVHRVLRPQTMTLWYNGSVLVTSPCNTGVAAAPTYLGTFTVNYKFLSTTMRGTNPDGSYYVDKGIRYVSYFNGGEALHAFPRDSYGTPQSVGCVELPLRAAEKIYPYTPVGTLVTIEK